MNKAWRLNYNYSFVELANSHIDERVKKLIVIFKINIVKNFNLVP